MSVTSGDADIAALAAVLADPGRTKMLLALGDGRALAATTLAAEAGVAASTASAHLAKLTSAGLCRAERHGRHRYYRLAGAHVGELLEALARLAPPAPVRSLREGTRAHALRRARTCYDHLAGQLGTAIMGSLISRGILAGGDGIFHAGDHGADRLAAPGRHCDYRLTPAGQAWMHDFGIQIPSANARPLIRYCIDWSEQRHHLAGALGAALLARLLDLGWLRRSPASRAVHLTDAGRRGIARTFGIDT
jgi:DNA-binding transcriptional ArsR family regulator